MVNITFRKESLNSFFRPVDCEGRIWSMNPRVPLWHNGSSDWNRCWTNEILMCYTFLCEFFCTSTGAAAAHIMMVPRAQGLLIQMVEMISPIHIIWSTKWWYMILSCADVPCRQCLLLNSDTPLPPAGHSSAPTYSWTIFDEGEAKSLSDIVCNTACFLWTLAVWLSVFIRNIVALSLSHILVWLGPECG